MSEASLPFEKEKKKQKKRFCGVYMAFGLQDRMGWVSCLWVECSWKIDLTRFEAVDAYLA